MTANHEVRRELHRCPFRAEGFTRLGHIHRAPFPAVDRNFSNRARGMVQSDRRHRISTAVFLRYEFSANETAPCGCGSPDAGKSTPYSRHTDTWRSGDCGWGEHRRPISEIAAFFRAAPASTVSLIESASFALNPEMPDDYIVQRYVAAAVGYSGTTLSMVAPDHCQRGLPFTSSGGRTEFIWKCDIKLAFWRGRLPRSVSSARPTLRENLTFTTASGLLPAGTGLYVQRGAIWRPIGNVISGSTARL
jgi:hypothetical protein